MPSPPVPPEIETFLRRPNHAVVATLRPDGSLHTAPTWYGWEDGRALLSMEDTRLRLRWMRPGAPVALSAIDPSNFYRHVSLIGHVAEVHADEDLADTDRLAVHYTGHPYRDRAARRVSAWVAVDAWHGLDPDVGAVLGPQATARRA
jgi:PPOX class probable F420-dependent enzyme